MLAGRAVNGAVHAAVASPAKDFFRRFGGFQHDIGTDAAGQLAAVWQKLHGPDAPCFAARNAAMVMRPMGPAPMTATVSPGRMETRRRECMAIARGSARAASANDITCGDGAKVGGRQIDALTEKARMAGIAEEADVSADVVTPA